MKLYSIEGNRQRLDGGAMFGNAPRALWSRWAPPDERGRIRLATRGLLVVLDDGRRVLLETGIGAFFEPKLRDRYGVEPAEHVLLESLAARGLGHEDIDAVVLSHLHFDHAGGLLPAWSPEREPALLFPNATYVVGRSAFERAADPHPRDRVSFVPELVALLEASGRLVFVDGAHSDPLGDAFSFASSDGHTPGMLLTRVAAPGGSVTFLADLVPGVPWTRVPITMGYDRFPERLVDEKQSVLARIAGEDGWAFFTHDPDVAAARIVTGGKGFAVEDARESVDGGLP